MQRRSRTHAAPTWHDTTRYRLRFRLTAAAKDQTLSTFDRPPTSETRMPMHAKLPSRLHHTAYVAKDLEKTRAFYEDVIGLPLMATWCESDELFGEIRTYCHCF